jgi:hypothetical protein
VGPSDPLALADADYASSFEVVIVDARARSPLDWAREMFEGAPGVLRWPVLVGWWAVLRLRPGTAGSPDHVLGWKITQSAASALVLETGSTILTARKTFLVNASQIIVTTYVRYERPLGKYIWSVVAPVHHRTEQLLLTRAVAHRGS